MCAFVVMGAQVCRYVSGVWFDVCFCGHGSTESMICVNHMGGTNNFQKLRARKSHDHRVFPIVGKTLSSVCHAIAFAFQWSVDDVHLHWCVCACTHLDKQLQKVQLEKVTTIVFFRSLDKPYRRYVMQSLLLFNACLMMCMCIAFIDLPCGATQSTMCTTWWYVCASTHTQRQTRKKVKNFI